LFWELQHETVTATKEPPEQPSRAGLGLYGAGKPHPSFKNAIGQVTARPRPCKIAEEGRQCEQENREWEGEEMR